MSHTRAVRERHGVIAAGNWIIDHVKIIDTWPAEDTLATITSQSDGNGGGPYNLLKDLAKMRCDFPLQAAGLIGNDADGTTIARDCEAHGIDRRRLHFLDQVPTSYTDVMTVASSGRRTFFHQHGANALLSAGGIDLGQSHARVFYLGYLCLLRDLDSIDAEGKTGASRVFEHARHLGMVCAADLVSSDRSDFRRVIEPSLPHLDVLFCNEFELARAVDGEISKDTGRLLGHIHMLRSRGMQGAVIVHMPEGALCALPDGTMIRQPAVCMPPGEIAGTAGAGDAFAAGFLFGLHEQWEPARSLELGVCVAAVSLRAATCSGSILPWEECLAIGRKMGFGQRA